jgi:pimeloyl-ACP methyl ester carboxylesterase
VKIIMNGILLDESSEIGQHLAQQSLSKTSPQALQSFLKAWREAQAAYAKDARAVRQFEAKRVNQTPEQFDALIERQSASHPSFEALLERTKEFNPTRSEPSLRRGILHNAKQLDDGSWQWRYDRRGHARSSDDPAAAEAAEPIDTAAASPLWDDFAAVGCPLTLVRGGVSPVVDDDDVAEARRRQPGIRVEVVDGAGHSIQGDRPLELAAIVAAHLAQH